MVNKSLIILLSTFFLFGCSGNGKDVKRFDDSYPLKLECKELGPPSWTVYRCENPEVVCYGTYESWQCQFKDINGEFR